MAGAHASRDRSAGCRVAFTISLIGTFSRAGLSLLRKIRVLPLFSATKWKPEPGERYAVITLIDVGRNVTRLPKHPGFVERLVIHVDDVTLAEEIVDGERVWHALTSVQAAEIAFFAHHMRDQADVLLVHCVAGLSRSPAVGTAIAEALEIDDLEIRSQDAIPNRHVLELMREALATPGS